MSDMYYGERIRGPLAEGVKFLKERLETKPNVKSVENLDYNILEVKRKFKSKLVIYIVDAYVLGDGATLEIIQNNPNINTITTISLWNEYTSNAKILAKEHNVALFTFNELMGAVYYNGSAYLDYLPPVKDE